MELDLHAKVMQYLKYHVVSGEWIMTYFKAQS